MPHGFFFFFFFCIFSLLYTILLHIDFFLSFLFWDVFLLQFLWFVLLARFTCFQKKKVLSLKTPEDAETSIVHRSACPEIPSGGPYNYRHAADPLPCTGFTSAELGYRFGDADLTTKDSAKTPTRKGFRSSLALPTLIVPRLGFITVGLLVGSQQRV